MINFDTDLQFSFYEFSLDIFCKNISTAKSRANYSEVIY